MLLEFTKSYSRGGLEVERMLHKLQTYVLVDQSLLGACMIIWYQWTRYVMYILDAEIVEMTFVFLTLRRFHLILVHISSVVSFRDEIRQL